MMAAAYANVTDVRVPSPTGGGGGLAAAQPMMARSSLTSTASLPSLGHGEKTAPSSSSASSLSSSASTGTTVPASMPAATTNASTTDVWDEEEVEESGAIVPAPTPSLSSSASSMDALAQVANGLASSSSSTTSSGSHLHAFGTGSSPLLGQRHVHLTSPPLHPLLQSPSIKSSSSPLAKDQPLSYLQIAGALASSQPQMTSSPLNGRAGLPFSFVPTPQLTNSAGDEFKVAFGAARDRLQLFERRFDGTDGTIAINVQQDHATTSSSSPSTPLKKRKVEEGKAGDSKENGKRRKKDGGGKAKKSGKKNKKSKADDAGDEKKLEKPDGGFTFMQGTYYILKREHRFMTAKEIVAIGQKEGLFASSKGKTPEATVAAGIYVDLKKPVSQFCQGCKVGKRGFGLSEWTDLESIPGPPDTPKKKKKEETVKTKGRGKRDETKPKGRPRKKRVDDENGSREKLKALDEDEEEEVEEEMVIVEEEEEEEGEIVQPSPKRPLPFGSPLV